MPSKARVIKARRHDTCADESCGAHISPGDEIRFYPDGRVYCYPAHRGESNPGQDQEELDEAEPTLDRDLTIARESAIKSAIELLGHGLEVSHVLQVAAQLLPFIRAGVLPAVSRPQSTAIDHRTNAIDKARGQFYAAASALGLNTQAKIHSTLQLPCPAGCLHDVDAQKPGACHALRRRIQELMKEGLPEAEAWQAETSRLSTLAQVPPQGGE